jgi:hypothetical protein
MRMKLSALWIVAVIFVVFGYAMWINWVKT